nr:MAG TPA: Dynein heavy chain AAA lid domain [Caudoviricetes sp.]
MSDTYLVLTISIVAGIIQAIFWAVGGDFVIKSR